MVYGEGIGAAELSIDYPGVTVDSLVRVDSPNYLLVYLNLADAQPGTMPLTFSLGKKRTQTINYQLKAQERSGAERQSFTIADVLYLLMPDRFANGDPTNDSVEGMNSAVVDRAEPSLRHGGDLAGIRQHLDYFTELGVTALWFTPVLENNSPDNNEFSTYHGYATTDYYRVDPRFGSNADYRALIDAAHARGLKVVMDMIFNHCGLEHPWVADQPTTDWFNWTDSAAQDYILTSYKLTPIVDPYASEIDKRETVLGWFVPTMPDLNQRNPHVMRYLVQNSIWWIETANIDGIRMDTYPYADREAMSHWIATLAREYPQFNVVGETWVTEPAYTASYQAGEGEQGALMVMDFALYDRLDRAKHEQTDNNFAGMNRVYNSLCYDYLYADPSRVLAFIENHDTDRFLGMTRDATALKQALAILLTIKRIPQLYYGTEILMNGTKDITAGFVRCDFPGGFATDLRSGFNAAERTAAENDMFDWLSALLHYRQGNTLISEGRQLQFLPHDGVYVIARQADGRTLLTILNGTDADATLHVARYAEVIGTATTARDVITGNTLSLATDLALAPRQTLIIEL